MHKFNYKDSIFEIGLTPDGSFIIAKLLTDNSKVLFDTSYGLYIGDSYTPAANQVVIIFKHYTAVRTAEYEKHSRRSYADLINYLEKLCKPEPVTLEDIYKECEGKTPEELINILEKYEVRMWNNSSSNFSAWYDMSIHEFDLKDTHKLGLRQIRRKEGC